MSLNLVIRDVEGERQIAADRLPLRVGTGSNCDLRLPGPGGGPVMMLDVLDDARGAAGPLAGHRVDGTPEFRRTRDRGGGIGGHLVGPDANLRPAHPDPVVGAESQLRGLELRVAVAKSANPDRAKHLKQIDDVYADSRIRWKSELESQGRPKTVLGNSTPTPRP